MSVSRVKMTSDDLEVSRIVAGFWRLNEWAMTTPELQSFIAELLDLGLTTMDHAFVYKSESPFGAALKADPSLRNRMEIVSKFGICPTGFGALGANTTNHYNSSATYLKQSVDYTLQELNTDYVDVMLVHRPDYLMRVDELARAFEDIVSAGKVRFFGVSNFTASQFDLLKSSTSLPLVTNQIECSPLCLEPLDNGVLDQCQQYGVKPMFWSCLAGGKLVTGSDERSVRVRAALSLIAEELGAQTIEQVIFAWLLMHPSQPLAIVGSSKIERIRSAVAAESLTLTREHWYAVWEASMGHRVP
ncbi:MAG: putative oxidoreductase [Flavobacteriales bacterium]|jgi:predicted oxidoreductase